MLKGLRCRSRNILKPCIRSTTGVAAEPSKKNSILMPLCKMPARAHKDQHFQYKNAIGGLYEWQRQHLQGPEFILHDGPPYANGDLHMGHAINKIVKDIINRNHVINGRKVHYVPGWDCHGLPIELKALSSKSQNKSKKLDPVEIRQTARNFAMETIKKQKEAFENWGVMADWKNQCYYTFDKKYVQHQLRRFYDLFKKKLVYRDVKPVYWSPSSGTALAEAELEYDNNHNSTQVYLKLDLKNVPESLKAVAPNSRISAIIWTTTPWSLVGNQAICYSENLQYSLIEDSVDGSVLIVASPLVSQLEEICNRKFKELHRFQGNELSSATYIHPLKKDINLPFLPADHVSSEKGTGLVHTAPAHGPEDFLVALKYNMKIENYVDEKGNFSRFSPEFDGLFALKDGQNKVIEYLNDRILHSGPFVHSYPLDWRTKKPIIIRASNQWFIDTDAIRNQALEALKKIDIIPSSNSSQHRQNFTKQLESRPYWCISRQRVWGVPIPVVLLDEKPLINSDFIDNVCDLIDKEGPDSWWTVSLDKIVPDSLLKENNVKLDQLIKGTDIMDIWLDSGLSWSNVLESKTADLYLEGLDQFTGWFQSSLMTGIALTGNAPYKNIYVHGFAVDSKGRKMSKSLGNVINPETIIKGGKNQQKEPAYGIDALRWWVAGHATQDTQVTIGNNILSQSHAETNKIRLLLKYLLGCIHDLKTSTVDSTNPSGYLDWYMLHLLHAYDNESKINYDKMNFNKFCLNTLYFTTNHVSALYCHAVKDRLYCDLEDSPRRRSAQIVMNRILSILLKHLAPVVPHLVEEAWSYHPLNTENIPFFWTDQRLAEPIWERVFVEFVMDTILDIRKEAHSKCRGRNTLEFAVTIRANPEIFDRLMTVQNDQTAISGDICDVLQVSRVDLVEGDAHEDEWKVTVDEIDRKLCGRCRRYTAEREGEPCERCREVLNSL